MTTETETENKVPGNGDPEVQRVLRKLVEREVYFNVGSWVQALTETIQSGGETQYIDYDETLDWWQGPPDEKQAILDAGYDTTEYADQWYWYESSDPRPWGDDPPTGFEVAELTEEMIAENEEFEDLEPGWYWAEDGDDLDWDNRYRTYEEACVACWEEQGLEAFDDEEDAVKDCIYMENVEVEDSRPDVFEHYAVSRVFASHLESYNEPLFDICGTQVWGRTCTGQHMCIDHVVWEIGRDMEILPGQENYRYWKED